MSMPARTSPATASASFALFARGADRRCTRPWAAGLAWVPLVAAVVALGLHALWPVDTPHARVVVLVEHMGQRDAPRTSDALLAGDWVHVAVLGEPGLFATLLNLDSRDHFVLAGPGWDQPATPGGRPLSLRFEADQAPGFEQLVLLAARAPVGDLSPDLASLNATPALTREARLAALVALVRNRAGHVETAVDIGPPLRHLDD